MISQLSLSFLSMLFLSMMSLICMLISMFFLILEKTFIIEWELLSMNSTNILVTYIFDWMSLMFLSFVLFISSMVLYYSGDYMKGDYNINRFIYLVLAFVLSMGFLIISPNLISILLGWDGLGLISYILVIYYQNEKSANAGMLTVLSNRIGDVAILLSIGLMFNLGGFNFNFYVYYLSGDKMLLFSVMIMLAALTKSAQIPFSAWLPAAMAAPTPVSALVHSSTLVTAGVYLMIRFSPMLENSLVKTMLLLISCLTMFMSGLGANFEYDLKKIIALSTLSQLGVMLSILSMGFTDLAFFHLLMHALFKALLFMCAGVMIHNLNEYQDIRLMGSVVQMMPLTSMCMNLSNLALCGFPFLAGFYSKDLILEVAYMSDINMISFFLYVVATGLTVSYSFRLIYYTMSGNFNLNNYSMLGDNSFIMLNPMVLMSVITVFSGATTAWVIFPDVYMVCMSLEIKLLTIMVSIMGFILGYFLNMMSLSNVLNSFKVYTPVLFMGSMWFLPTISTFNPPQLGLAAGGNYVGLSEKGWSEMLGGQGLFMFMMIKMDSWSIYHFNNTSLFMKIFLMVMLIFMVFVVFFYNNFV
uniref:NADH-ubiquinone oxidoreductase chain 5 n=1 Tax=Gastroptychus investigatoris TaxID=2020971 RepID=A0A3S6JBA7_9EUCA|nr:NADH dehydrogenase subunit 5 [Gastroptychus investigatoris]